MLVEALTAGTAEAFYPLASHLHTQAEPAWCGLGTLVTVLNALEIDPGRQWKGPWRFFGEELLVCCKSLELAASDGLTLAEVECLASCNGAEARAVIAEPGRESDLRAALDVSVRAPAGPFVVASYARGVLGQTGSGHFSPLAAVHAERDHVLVLDVARFKYPPHWVPIALLYRAMLELDPQSGTRRGWMTVGRGPATVRPEAVASLRSRLLALGAPICPPPPPADPTPGTPSTR